MVSPTTVGLGQQPYNAATSSGAIRYSSQTTQVALRPVPREGSQMNTRPATASATPQGWNLQWRRSSNVAPQAEAVPHPVSSGVETQSSETSGQGQPVIPTSGQLERAEQAPKLKSISQAAWMAPPQRVEDRLAPSGAVEPIAPTPIPLPATPDHDFFNDPFGEQRTSADKAAAESLPAPAPNTQRRDEWELPPSQAQPMNELRAPNQTLELPEPGNQTLELPAPKQTPKSRVQSDSPLREMLRQNQPSKNEQDSERLPPPKYTPPLDRSDDVQFNNPFARRSEDADAKDRDRLNAAMDGRDKRADGVGSYEDDEELRVPSALSCSDFRSRIAAQTIDQVSLDISAPYRPDEIDMERYEKLKADFDEKQHIRQWRNIAGVPLASGRLRDLAYEKAIVETEYGSLEELPINRLSEADVAYITENWGLPNECLLEQVAYVPRTWTPITMTWKASNLCHTPLYFEDVNLERYGHTHGPLLEPVVQSAHFFGNIAVLPYKMGVHGPKECQYALGYYRPGNCAPWIVPPVPISVRGALSQAAVMTGGFWLIP